MRRAATGGGAGDSGSAGRRRRCRAWGRGCTASALAVLLARFAGRCAVLKPDTPAGYGSLLSSPAAAAGTACSCIARVAALMGQPTVCKRQKSQQGPCRSATARCRSTSRF